MSGRVGLQDEAANKQSVNTTNGKRGKPFRTTAEMFRPQTQEDRGRFYSFPGRRPYNKEEIMKT